MLPIKCGVESEDNDLKLDRDWPVLIARLNSSIEDSAVNQHFHKENQIHIFSSQSAIHFVSKSLQSISTPHEQFLKNHYTSLIGVGSVTDAAVKNMKTNFSQFLFNTPDISVNGKRENGLNWTLERLEQLGMIPRQEIVLWTKTWSVSEKILCDFRKSRQWQGWASSTVEIYSIEPSTCPMPVQAVTAIVQNQQVCFSVKSAEVLDATVAALLAHLHKSTVRDLPQNILFSVWEKSALARAQQLYLQNRLIPAHEFEAALIARESNG
ncbi:MAG: hypothetical protein RJB13_1048 [Pseudomonadota bacterium]